MTTYEDAVISHARYRRQFINLAEAFRQLDVPVAAKQRLYVPLAERIDDDTSLLAPEAKAAFSKPRFLAHCSSSFDGTPGFDAEAGGWRYQEGEATVTLILGDGVRVEEPAGTRAED